jgi:hypothetical protein
VLTEIQEKEHKNRRLGREKWDMILGLQRATKSAKTKSNDNFKNHAATQPFLFLDLPGGLRKETYKYYLNDTEDVKSGNDMRSTRLRALTRGLGKPTAFGGTKRSPDFWGPSPYQREEERLRTVVKKWGYFLHYRR